MNLKPLHDRVIVKPEKEEEKTKGGLFIPDTAKKEKPQKGEIIAVGEGAKNDEGKILPMSVKKGDHILFSKYAGNDVTLDDTEYIIMRESDILAIIGK